MWTLEHLRQKNIPMACVDGHKWVATRPENYKKKNMSLPQRIRHAWAVFTCRAEAFTWPEGQ